MPPSWNLPWSLNLNVISASFESLWHSLYTPLKLLDTSYNFIPRPCLIHHFPSPSSQGFPRGSAGKESTWNNGDLGSIPGLGRSPGEGNSYPLQYSVLENSMDYIVHWVTKSQTLKKKKKESDMTEQLHCVHCSLWPKGLIGIKRPVVIIHVWEMFLYLVSHYLISKNWKPPSMNISVQIHAIGLPLCSAGKESACNAGDLG